MKFRGTIVLLALFVAVSAHAQLQRTFVASTGSDANPCSRALPCRNFAAAMTAVAEGGEVVVLDSAGYGPVSITKSVSIIAPPGIYGGITALTGDAITVNVTSLVSAVVTLRGLTLNGQGADFGIDVAAVDILHVEDCEIAKFANAGVYFPAGGRLIVTGTVARDNGQVGVQVWPSTGNSVATIDRCSLSNNGLGGLLAAGSSSVTASNTVAAFNQSYGMAAYVATLSVKHCVLSSNGEGLFVFGVGTAWITDSIFSGNGYGIDAASGTVYTFGTNEMAGNTSGATTGAGTFTTVSRY
jgi:parallel beta helix pectate lyase-like protein